MELKLLNLKVLIEGSYSGLSMMDNNGAGGGLYLNGFSVNAYYVDSVIVSLKDGTTKVFIASASDILQIFN